MATKVDAPAAQLSGVQLYSRFALAGAICCSVTHGALTPVDVYVPNSLPRALARCAAPCCDAHCGSPFPIDAIPS